MKLMRSLVISIFLHACQSMTLTADSQRRIEAFEMRCYPKILNISYRDDITNEEARKRITATFGSHDKLNIGKKRKIIRYGHVTKSSAPTKKKKKKKNPASHCSGRKTMRQHPKRWEDNIRKWTC